MKIIKQIKDIEPRIIFLLLFILVVGVMSLVYNYHDILFYRPQSVHVWRQADCATQVLNYAQKDYNFFKPQMHALVSDDYTTGYAVEELPVIFYFVATLYKIFGTHEALFRITNLLIFFIGLYYLFKFYDHIINNKPWALLFTILLFTSPVIVYYANTFISNVPALSITFIGWFYFFKFYEKQKQKFLIISILLFTLSALIKISELISLFTIVGILVLDFFKFIKFREDKRVFENKLKPVLYLLTGLLAVFLWYIFSHYYNNIHDQKYYLYRLGDIFSLDSSRIEAVKTNIRTYFSYYYQSRLVLYFYLITFILNLVFFKKTNKLLFAITSIMLVGSIFFVLLWFEYLKSHDYYVISLFITTIFSTLTFIELLLRNYPKIFNNYISKIVFIIFLAYGVHYADKKINSRYNGWENKDKAKYAALYNISPYLEEIGVGLNDRVISIPDNSPNISLYLMNRFGWSSFINKNYSELISLGIARNAKYLIVIDPQLLINEKVKPFLYHPIGEYKNISIFKLDNIANYSYYDNRTYEKIFWNMEDLSEDSKFLVSDTLNRTIRNNEVSNDFSFSEQNSLKVLPGNFALNYVEEKLQPGVKYKIKLKKYSKDVNNSHLIICISSPEFFYLTHNQLVKLDSSEWQQLEVNFVVPAELKNNRMSIDYRNTGDCDVYLDDFEIIKTY